MRFPLVPVALATLAILAPLPSDADHISARIQAGTIQFIGLNNVGSTAISGNHGFAFNATSNGGASEAQCTPCEVGQTISLSGAATAGFGTAVYRGQTYEFNFTNGGGAIELQGPSFTLPPGTGTEPTIVEFETPFTVLDRSFLFLQSGANGEIQHQLKLTGSGTATVLLQVFYDTELQRHLYWFQSIRYDFSKKPKADKAR